VLDSGAEGRIAAATLSGNSLRQTVYTHCASVHQAAKLLAALLRTASNVEITRNHAGWFSAGRLSARRLSASFQREALQR